jgi:hypothetical protein
MLVETDIDAPVSLILAVRQQNARWRILFPQYGTIFAVACFYSLIGVFSGASKKRPSPLYHGWAGEFLMIEKKTPGPPDAISKSNSVDDSASPTKKRNPNVKDHIGRQLRALYDEVANQPVPDRFMELLNRLEVKRGEE